MDIGLGLFGGFGMVDFAIVNCTARSSVEFKTVGSDDCSKLKVNQFGVSLANRAAEIFFSCVPLAQRHGTCTTAS